MKINADPLAVGKRIEEAKRKIKITYEELSELTGIKKGTIVSYKRGLALPNQSNLIRIATVLGVEPSYLLLGGQLTDCITCGNKTSLDLQVCTICAKESQKQLVAAIEVIENLLFLNVPESKRVIQKLLQNEIQHLLNEN